MRRGARRRQMAAHAVAAGDASTAELFGARLKYDDSAWDRHRDAGARMSLPGVARRLPHLVGQSVRLAWAVDPFALVAVAVAEIGQGLTAAFGLVATNQVLVELLAGGPTPSRVRAALPALLFVGLMGVLGAGLAAASTVLTGRLEPQVERAADVRLLERVVRVEMATLEDPEFRSLLRSATLGTDAARYMVGNSVAVVNALLSLAAAGTVLTVLHPLLLPLLALIVVPQAVGTLRTARRAYRSIQGWLDNERQQDLLTNLMTAKENGQEVRVHGVGDYLLDHFVALARASEAEQTRLARAEAGTNLAASALSGMAAALTYGALGWLLTSGRVPLSTAGTAALAIRTGTAGLRQVVLYVTQLYQKALHYNDLLRVCAQAEAHAIPVGGGDVDRPPALIEAQGLTFTYPGRDTPAVRDVDLRIPAGSIVAFVGRNGSGKSTLAKLLSRLYEPQAGRILWDGVDTAELAPAALQHHVALIPQDFAQWPFTAGTNVRVGRPRRPADDLDLADVAASADATGVLAELPNGWATLLGREFEGGVGLSGGQWQRIADARARWRQATLLLFDEPTSALDPEAEVAAYDRIRALAGEGHTVVLITHRMASVRHADHIYVLDAGRVVESGSHDDLMSIQHGIYAAMFTIQSEQYTAARRTPRAKPPAAPHAEATLE
ncbi:ABC transporter ATP-binding protein [Embleya sp. NBC_00896]|uniref:ABC transporter ATP-binding protein n=1 Tax=Embleya sp. NBC_00896 TaxID=2975961 RepID=UPI002F91A886|nr:ABC transporter ATP-binding protein/permease [Embleya sp. NBC_00896]